MSCCSKIGDILRQIVDALGPILTIALLCVAAYFLIFAAPEALTALSGFTWLPTSLTTLSLQASTWGYLALGAAVVLDPATAAEIVGSVASGVGTIAGTVVTSVVGGVVSGLFGTSTSNLLLIGLAGYLLYAYFTREKSAAELEAEAIANAEATTKRQTLLTADASRDQSDQLALQGAV